MGNQISAEGLRAYRKSPQGPLLEHTYEVMNGGRSACPVLFVSAGLQDGTGRKFTVTDDNVAWVPSALPHPSEANWDRWHEATGTTPRKLDTIQLGIGWCYYSTHCGDDDKVVAEAAAARTVAKNVCVPQLGLPCSATGTSPASGDIIDDLVDLGFSRSAPPAYHGFPMHSGEEQTTVRASLPDAKPFAFEFKAAGKTHKTVAAEVDTLYGDGLDGSDASGFAFINGFYVPPGAVLELDVCDLPPVASKCPDAGGSVASACRIGHYKTTLFGKQAQGYLSHGEKHNLRHDLVDWDTHPDGVNRRTVRVQGGHAGNMVTSTAGQHWAASATQSGGGAKLGLLVSYEYAKALTFRRTAPAIWNTAVPAAPFGDGGDRPSVTLVRRYRFRFEPVATQGYLNATEWLMRQACMINLRASAGDRKAASPNQPITVGGRELVNWRPQSSFCDHVVKEYCELHLDEAPCACFGERAKAQRDIAALGVGLPPQCFGGCAQVDRAYQLKVWADTSCDENVCAAVVKEHGRSIVASGRQEVVCANRKYTLNQTGDGDGDVGAVLASLPPDLDRDEARGQRGTSPTSIVAYTLGALFTLLLVFFILLWLRARRGLKP